jgi:hypothetical protein
MLPEAIVENDSDGEKLSSRSNHHHSNPFDDATFFLNFCAAQISSSVAQLTTYANQLGPIANDLKTNVAALSN